MMMKCHAVFRAAQAGAVCAALGLAFPAAAQTAKPAAKATPKSAKVAAPPAFVVPDASPDQVQAADLVYYGRYACEFDQTVEIAQSPKHSAYVDVKHGKGAWLMKPVLSSTGAIRLEDVRNETLMVQIASKSMLLNVKTGRRVVDECITEKQRELIAAVKAAKEAEVARAAAEAEAAKAAKAAKEAEAAKVAKEAEAAAAKVAAEPTVATSPSAATSAPR